MLIDPKEMGERFKAWSFSTVESEKPSYFMQFLN
jgi:SAM-dependent MidA family methyltransferase